MNNNSKTTIENKSQLIQYFIDGIKKNNNQKIGVEHEKFLFSKNDFKRIDYKKLKQVFETLVGTPDIAISEFLCIHPSCVRRDGVLLHPNKVPSKIGSVEIATRSTTENSSP